MKYLVACLGNIGAEYAHTRHNAGFMVADRLVGDAGGVFSAGRLGSVAEVRCKGRTLVVLKPSTYMNGSGKAVRYWLTFCKIDIERLLVAVDDIALPFGSLRLRSGGSDGGHNGLKDIIAAIGTQQFSRLRIGVGNGFERGRQIDYVLGEWTSEERQLLPSLTERAAAAVKMFATDGIVPAMNAFNSAK